MMKEDIKTEREKEEEEEEKKKQCSCQRLKFVEFLKGITNRKEIFGQTD